jgi:hypothetical protein
MVKVKRETLKRVLRLSHFTFDFSSSKLNIAFYTEHFNFVLLTKTSFEACGKEKQ